MTVLIGGLIGLGIGTIVLCIMWAIRWKLVFGDFEDYPWLLYTSILAALVIIGVGSKLI
ncbi:hypothetical protein LCGC14_1642850 [marine sediment metagenome]|uniref:Uncharacterized protein n=1 Tax=marine sediment metagenome TaxID=412755 RepID=A0A0F9HZ16_9ZZZZ